jgi:oligogalacturonide lyase
VPEGWKRGGGLSVSGDGLHAFLVEARDASSRLRLVPLLKGEPSTVVETQANLSDPLPRPKRAGILYRQEDSLWLVNYDGQQNRRLKTAPGRIGPAVWSADGVNVLYLHYPQEPKALNAIREHTPDTNDDRLVAPTSQFVHFGRNADSSVFVGASGSKASPYVLILLRVARRELTLCEHGASDPMRVSPVFSPDSQKVLFQSDRDGKPAIYAMAVDRLVEKTVS